MRPVRGRGQGVWPMMRMTGPSIGDSDGLRRSGFRRESSHSPGQHIPAFSLGWALSKGSLWCAHVWRRVHTPFASCLAFSEDGLSTRALSCLCAAPVDYLPGARGAAFPGHTAPGGPTLSLPPFVKLKLTLTLAEGPLNPCPSREALGPPPSHQPSSPPLPTLLAVCCGGEASWLCSLS